MSRKSTRELASIPDKGVLDKNFERVRVRAKRAGTRSIFRLLPLAEAKARQMLAPDWEHSKEDAPVVALVKLIYDKAAADQKEYVMPPDGLRDKAPQIINVNIGGTGIKRGSEEARQRAIAAQDARREAIDASYTELPTPADSGSSS